MKLAEKTLRESAALAPVSAYRAFNLRELPNFLIHRGRHQEAVEAARALLKTDYPQSRCVAHALAGQALLALGRVDEAKTELEAARTEFAKIPEVTAGLDPNPAAVAPWVDALRGELLLRAGQREEGRAVFQEVARGLRAAPGPDAWSQGLFRLELLLRSAMEAGDWELAEHIAAQMLEHDAAYGGSHLARALVLRKKGDEAGAATALGEAKRFWRDADPDLAELKQLAARADEKR
jgi:tetratricopeptide (TPR) repeat protein